MARKVVENIVLPKVRSREVTPDDISTLTSELLRTFSTYGFRLNRSAPLDGSEAFTALDIGGGAQILKHLSATGVLDFGSTGAGLSADLTITVTGAAVGDTVCLGVPNGSVLADSCYTAWVSSADTVSVRFNNYSSGALDPASGTFRVDVWTH